MRTARVELARPFAGHSPLKAACLPFHHARIEPSPGNDPGISRYEGELPPWVEGRVRTEGFEPSTFAV